MVAEPHIHELPASLTEYGNISLGRTTDVVDAADIVVLLVDHDQFRVINRSMLAGKVLYDTRGAWR
jgi:UDP-N-acetyl-D-mannosaminuronic acid dehydrogenase